MVTLVCVNQAKFSNNDVDIPARATSVTLLTQRLEQLRPTETTHKSTRKTIVSPRLTEASHVFEKHDAIRKPLQMPYDGPFKVIRRAEKFFEMDMKGKTTIISIDRLKPAFLADVRNSGRPPYHFFDRRKGTWFIFYVTDVDGPGKLVSLHSKCFGSDCVCNLNDLCVKVEI